MIEKVIETLATPGSWTKNAFARTREGRVIGPECQNAACFCIGGAVLRNDTSGPKRWLRFIETAIWELFPTRNRRAHIPDFNDHPDTTHEDVLLVLRRARELELTAA